MKRIEFTLKDIPWGKCFEYPVVSGLIGMAALILSGGCADDIENPRDEFNFDGVVLNIPSPDMLDISGSLTRAEATEVAAEVEEAKIKEMRFYAFPTDGGEATIVELNPTDGRDFNKYQQYKVELPRGDYRFYIVANGSWENIKSETDLQQQKFVTGVHLSADGSVPESGLPMSCTLSDMKMESEGSYITTDSYTVKGGSAGSLYCDLKFAVAKVRLNVVRDKVPAGSMEEITASNITRNVSSFEGIGTDESVYSTTPLAIRKGVYGNVPSDLNNIPHFSTGSAEAPENGWCYQTTFYLPERLIESGEMTSITVPVNADGGKIERTFKLGGVPGENGAIPENPTQLRRSYFYEYTLTQSNPTEIKMSVEPWTLNTIKMALQGPVELVVDRTSIGDAENAEYYFKGGDVVELEYYSNVDVEFKSPEYNGIPAYTFVKKERQGVSDPRHSKYVEVRFNTNLPVMSHAQIDERGLNYFHVVAGNISKKIDVYGSLAAYLVVTPELVEIKAKEIRTGTQAEVNFHYATNLSDISCEVSYTYDVANYKGASYTAGFPSSDVNLCSRQPVSTGSGTLGMLPGETIFDNFSKDKEWHNLYLTDTDNTSLYNREVVLRFRYTATENGVTLTDEGYVHIYPYNSTYTLHFRHINDAWTTPHIYVYQPLEYFCYDSGHNRAEYVMCHYQDYMYENALQYSYTGCITFKGWSSCLSYLPSGHISSGDGQIRFNSPDDNVFYETESYKGLAPGTCPSSDVYYKNVDFIADHRAALRESISSNRQNECGYCNNPNRYEQKWPGVLMIKEEGENDGWYKITLPEMCVPGKTLIMFVFAHSAGQYDLTQRYPLHLRPGVPLYDYEDKEGWFLYDPEHSDKSEFTDDKPVLSRDLRFSTDKVYRIYWKKSTGWNMIHMWANSNDPLTFVNGVNGNCDSNNWGINQNYDGSSGDYYYKDFMVRNSGLRTVNFVLHSSVYKTGDLSVGASSFNSSGYYYYN